MLTGAIWHNQNCIKIASLRDEYVKMFWISIVPYIMNGYFIDGNLLLLAIDSFETQ